MIITSVMMIIIDVAGNARGQYIVDGTVNQGHGRDNIQYHTWIISTHFPSAFLSQALYIGWQPKTVTRQAARV